MHPALNMQNSFSHDFGISDDLWIETKSPDGRKYYYNAKSRESKWEQPENARVMTLQQIKLIASNENGSQAQDSLQMNRPPHILNPTPYFGHYINTSLPIPGNPRMIMFQPPTVCAPPPVFPAINPILPVRDIANCSLNVHSISYISPTNSAGDTSTLNASPSTYVCTNLSEYSKGREQQLVTNDNPNKELEPVSHTPRAFNDNNNRIEYASVSEKS
ncbi:Transcription elongation regulator 1, partial [Stegodyphus mimosarum]